MSLNETQQSILKWIELRNSIMDMMGEDAHAVIELLMSRGHSLREIGRATKLSPTYLSMVWRREKRISPGAYVKLLEVQERVEGG